MMFAAGDYVVYGCKGIHRVTGITTLNIDGVSKDKKYYVMQPFQKPEGSVYVPVDAPNVNMRLIMTEAEAKDFIRTIADIEILDIQNNKQRDETYKACIKSCEPAELMRVIKTLYKKREEREAAGKKLTLTDLHYMEEAEKILYEELGIIFKLPREAVPEFIMDTFEKESV